MTKRDAVAIALKLLGVVWLVQTLGHAVWHWQSLSMAWGTVGPVPRTVSTALWTLNVVLPFAAAGAVLHFTDRIAAWLVPRDADLHLLPLFGTGRHLLDAGIRLMGVALAVQVLPRTASAVWSLWFNEAARDSQRVTVGMGAWTLTPWDAAVQPVVTLVLGVALMLGGGWLARILAGPPAPGTPPAGPEAEA